jgi:hypothetical protein
VSPETRIWGKEKRGKIRKKQKQTIETAEIKFLRNVVGYKLKRLN